MFLATLEEAKKFNETAACRCVGLCIETRPDFCGEAEVKRMLEFGATRVEIGVQTLDDEIYRLVNRGHLVEDVVRATALIKKYGFKVHYHWMPGLPGSTPEHDLAMSRQLFDDPLLQTGWFKNLSDDGSRRYNTGKMVSGRPLPALRQQYID